MMTNEEYLHTSYGCLADSLKDVSHALGELTDLEKPCVKTTESMSCIVENIASALVSITKLTTIDPAMTHAHSTSEEDRVASAMRARMMTARTQWKDYLSKPGGHMMAVEHTINDMNEKYAGMKMNTVSHDDFVYSLLDVLVASGMAYEAMTCKVK